MHEKLENTVCMFMEKKNVTYGFPALLQAVMLSNTQISWKFSRILGKFVTKKPVTIAEKSMANRSSALEHLLELLDAALLGAELKLPDPVGK